ncbi:MFS transporter [Corynebacterium choanae]|uniref:Antiseptic resistance protein n=1 Tax=Corynebacterium choanae TaxID=1862358 RepID=A0A3G6J772_9CORY|nr:MFS transporter [Corynebacterium choanae]AZA13917.1 Antiseptic resistance protein [Corynebacterium choanae]
MVARRQISEQYRWFGLAALSIGVAVLAVDATVLNFAIPAITTDLQPSAQQLLWIVDIYAFCVASLLITCGTLADRVGPKRLLLLGTVAFATTSVAAGFAPSADWLVVFRALQGAAGATLMPSTLALISVLFPIERERAQAVSIWIAIYAVGAAAGPLVGGVLLEHFHWGSVFFINAPLCVLMVLGVWLWVPEGSIDRTHRFDLPGAIASMVALFALVYGVKIGLLEGFAWSVVVAFGVAVVAGWLLRHRLLHARFPLLDVGLLTQPAVVAIVAVNFVGMFVAVGVLFFIAQYLQLVLGLGLIQSALYLAPSTVVALVVTIATGRVMGRVSPRRLITLGLLVLLVGCVLLGVGVQAWIPFGLRPGAVAGAMVVIACGAGMIDPVTNYFIVSVAPPNKAGQAASLSETGYELGAAVGTATLGAVVMMVFHQRAAVTELSQRALSTLAAAHEATSDDPALRAMVDTAFTDGVAAACVVAAAAVAVCCWWSARALAQTPRAALPQSSSTS